MLLRNHRRTDRQRGQAIILFVVAMGIFLIGALGLAIDGSQLYAHRQMLQAAVDSAAEAAIMSVFDKTNTGANAFGGSSFTCTTTDVRTPCYFARQNGAGATSADQVDVDFPGSASGVSLSPTDTPNLVRVTVTRTVSTGLIRFIGPSLSTIRAAATAAIVDVVSPTPILILHPTLAGALSMNGNPTVQICGGPRRSMQINSNSAATISISGGPTIDLSRAGPLDPGNCTTGTGGEFGAFGGPATRPAAINVGVAGKYIQPSSPILDPLATVPAPAVPAAAPAPIALANGVSGCPASPGKPCKLYSPGLYSTGILVKNETAVLKPGIYYIQSNGFTSAANGDLYMSTGFPNDPVTGQGILVYITGNNASDILSVGANGSVFLTGTPSSSIYKGILFFADHNSLVLKQHSLGGNGSMSLVGTIYLSNTLARTTATPAIYQSLSLQGTPGNSTFIAGQVVVDALNLGGNAGITMTLNPNGTLHIRQVALVN